MMISTDCNVPTSNLWIYNTFPDNVALVAASCRPLVVLHQHHDARGYLMRVQAAIYDFRSRNKKRSRVICAPCVAGFGFWVSCKSMETLIDSKCRKAASLSVLSFLLDPNELRVSITNTSFSEVFKIPFGATTIDFNGKSGVSGHYVPVVPVSSVNETLMLKIKVGSVSSELGCAVSKKQKEVHTYGRHAWKESWEETFPWLRHDSSFVWCF